MQTISLSDGVVINVPDNISIALGGGGGTPPTGTIQYNVQATGTLVYVSGPQSALDTTYFSEADLVAACQSLHITDTVVVNNNGNIHQAWPATGTTPPPVVTPPGTTPPGTAGTYSQTIQPPPSGQTRPVWSPLNNNTLEALLIMPTSFPFAGHSLNIDHLGQIVLNETPGAQVIGRNVTIANGAGEVLWSDLNDTSPTVSYTINNPNPIAAGGSFNVNQGDYLRVTMTIPGYQPGMNTDTLLDWSCPWRY